ncbi:unnamed protein product [Rotaria socialis]|uniref:Uncharacterized protein n=1 Tax=Rotaria socialis TaxID=392032 RepID=A0A821B2C6_9BILA|nr:unnamed protein product [Rotaria socialis]
MPRTAACSWGISFIIYYGILLCTGGLFGLTTTISMFLLMKGVPIVISCIMYGLFILQMLTFSIAFIIDIFIPKLLNVSECIFFPRNLFHFIMTPIVLLVYSFVEFYALHEVAIFGKKVCKYGASKKLDFNFVTLNNNKYQLNTEILVSTSSLALRLTSSANFAQLQPSSTIEK